MWGVGDVQIGIAVASLACTAITIDANPIAVVFAGHDVIAVSIAYLVDHFG